MSCSPCPCAAWLKELSATITVNAAIIGVMGRRSLTPRPRTDTDMETSQLNFIRGLDYLKILVKTI